MPIHKESILQKKEGPTWEQRIKIFGAQVSGGHDNYQDNLNFSLIFSGKKFLGVKFPFGNFCFNYSGYYAHVA